MKDILSVQERGSILKQLSNDQREFLLYKAKRGKKTVFANVMAKDKGLSSFSEHLTDEQLEGLLEDWVLEDVIDGGDNWRVKELYCECGKQLRYQYIIRHVKTNEIRKFGIVHFEEHSGLPSEIVKEVIKGFQKIDYELDELLVKISSGWHLPFILPEDLQIPSDIEEHLNLHLPLLDRQIQRLGNLISEHEEKIHRQRISTKPPSVTPQKEANNHKYDYHMELELFEREDKPSWEISELSHVQMDAISDYLREGVTSARLMCELLIKDNKAPNKRYSTAKPKIYPYVCLFLKSLADVGDISVEQNNITDLIVKGRM
ncbi:hypothetical protein HNQ94_000201 [Salirhabdus euzebyi]|uniref:DUF3895 domain-containing protein n=1 Tax=Salirhabdus euzebyi TaxID=394506 RepID=A0A841PSL5_9BACI|nr:DUF3895 domain-containing protein [Salirhabdus euzebyi]MBB6451780.1 hypothetical protein [Salirhabdus euzebyi]